MGSFSIWHWLIVLVIVVLVFGTKKLRNMGGDVGGAVKNFKDAVKEGGESLAAPVAAAAVEPKLAKTPASIKAPAKPKAAASAAKKPAAEKPAAKKPAVKKAVAKKPAAKKPAAKKPAAKKPAAKKPAAKKSAAQ